MYQDDEMYREMMNCTERILAENYKTQSGWLTNLSHLCMASFFIPHFQNDDHKSGQTDGQEAQLLHLGTLLFLGFRHMIRLTHVVTWTHNQTLRQT